MIQVSVQPYDPAKSLLDLRRKAQREGLYIKAKQSRFHESSTEKRIREGKESDRRRRKSNRSSFA